MKNIPFHKYEGTGNDFVLIDQRQHRYLTRQDTAEIERICHRRFGIGADGLILLQLTEGYDFEMVYFNSDGRESTMCGNGGRCIAAFAHSLGVVGEHCHFLAIDGPHEAKISEGLVELKMGNVPEVEIGDGYFILNTGSPHYVVFVEDLSDMNIVESGQVIRYSERFRKEGINVNFVEKTADGIEVATYERGVEDETLSCGTGVTAAALSFILANTDLLANEVAIATKGGNLKVRFNKKAGNGFEGIWLCGPARKVFSGEYWL
ncbi:MAG: diaminopimelate epimerase [Saprospiraceae bacterium]|nr:diaminopimelate epimerase [Saprospiraceae bacterium]MCF8249922.1 diaminopimelate epimerase [Saprospiraceae bacterium]MCF8279335.1 diaminopimelate epimerase [Bacteroidales bacterium]MCF8310026.1 diaminopimelate epimerase [Saprospiraceae bacterium]MCF8438926.1 diaminopimelate epimerase [Saprospiraceae bacterium]